MKLSSLLAVAVGALLLSGCAGYKVGPAKPTFMAKVNTIAVPSFKNSTLIPRLEVPVANSVIKQFQQDGTYQITSVDKADAVLDGTIVNIKRQPARVLRGNVLQTTEFELILTLDVRLTDRISGKELSHRQYTGQTSFFVGGDIQQDEQQAIPLAAEKAAVDIVSTLSEGF
jgi:PBP1b-binding outer membrane lipoprotein LpoB